MNFVIGADVGTTATKTLLVSENGAIAAEANQSYPLDSPQPGWNEQNPADWWQAVKKTARKVLRVANVKKDQVLGIGLSGQMHGSVFLDMKGHVIRPALLWNDQRTAAECAEITAAAGGEKKLLAMVNNAALPGFTAPKILWLRKNEPNNFRKVRQILLPKDYVRLRMTGEYAAEMSDAAGTALLDVKKRRWNRRLLDALELDADLLPPLLESPDVAGRLTRDAASAMGLREGIPVVAGAGDQAAAAVGMGIVKQGLVSSTIGTSGVVFAYAKEPVENPGGVLQSFCHAVPGAWCVFGCMLSAGASLDWARDVLFPKRGRKDVYEIIEREAASAPSGAKGLVFLPYLEGERCPHPDPQARGAWIGLTKRHERGDLIRAVMEGITFGMADQLAFMRELDLKISQIRCAGGGANSPFWLQLQADVYNAQTVTVDTVDASAFGAALLAGVGAGFWSTVPQACNAAVHVKQRYRPRKKQVATYNSRHAIYRDLYHALADTFPKLQAGES